jgi:hypothetical protein
MSLPQFDVQGSLFESLGTIAPDLFADNDKYKLVAKKVWLVVAQFREQLAECYQAHNGRPGVEPGDISRLTKRGLDPEAIEAAGGLDTRY